MSNSYELIALNKDGEERAYIRFDEGESWDVFELFDIIEGWKDTDMDRRVIIRATESLPPPPNNANVNEEGE